MGVRTPIFFEWHWERLGNFKVSQSFGQYLPPTPDHLSEQFGQLTAESLSFRTKSYLRDGHPGHLHHEIQCRVRFGNQDEDLLLMRFFLLRKRGLVLHCMHAFLQYVLAAPVVANAIHGLISGAKDVDNWCYHLLLLGALRCLCQQLWTTYSRLHCLVKKHQINACGIEFEQVDREFHSYFLLLCSL